MVQWAGAQVAVTTIWFNFKELVGRNHWPSCWHGSYGNIYIPPQSPEHSMDSHCAINTKDIQLMPVYITVKYGESQANSSSRLETRGLQWYDSANVTGFQWIQEPQDVGGKDKPGPGGYYHIDENLKAVRKFPVQNEECRFKIRFKGNLFSHKALKLSNPV